jgi:hypothetical protein
MREAAREELAALDVDGLRVDLWDAVGQLGQRQDRLELAAGASAYPTRKAHVLARYRARADYGQRDTAGAAARQLAGEAGVPASTARAYVYEELGRLAREEAGQ